MPEALSTKLKALSAEREVSMNQLVCELIAREVGKDPVNATIVAHKRKAFLFRLPTTLDAKLEALSTRNVMSKAAYLRHLIYRAYAQEHQN